MGQIRPPFYRPRSGPDRVRRFITGLALDRLPYRGHIFPNRGPVGAPPKFLHGNVLLYNNICVHVSTETSLLFTATKNPSPLSFVLFHLFNRKY